MSPVEDDLGVITSWIAHDTTQRLTTPIPSPTSVIDFTDNTGDISEVLFEEDKWYVLNRRTTNTSDLTLTRDGDYGAYTIKTSFILLDSNTISVPSGNDIALFISGDEIKVYPIGEIEADKSFLVGNLFDWSRTDEPPTDRLELRFPARRSPVLT